MIDINKSERLFYYGAIAVVALALYLSSLYSYLLFHSLIEIVTIAVAFALFIITWNARDYLASGYLRVLGIGYGFIALIDLLHTLAYKGLDVFPGYGANLPTQLWIAARYLQAATLIAAPLFVERRVNDRAVFGGYVASVAVLVATVFSGDFPDCYIEGTGLTAFKIGSEYLITGLLLASLFLLYRKRQYFNDRVFFLAAASIACTALSEISFTAYVSVYGFANLVGHFAKLAAFYLVYRAILVTGFREPFDLIFRDLKQAQDALRKAHDTLEEKVKERTAELRHSEESYRSLIQKVQTAILLHDGQGRILVSNPLAQKLLGLSADQLLGKALIDPEWHFLREDGSVASVIEYPVSRVLSSRQPLKSHVAGISRPGQDEVTWVLVNAEPEYDAAGEITLVIVSFVDITERKQAEEALQRLNRELHAISNCNQTLMRADDEQTLLDAVCRIVCDEAGYRMAWVGYAENNDAKGIRPVAWAGAETGYLKSARLTWADTELGRGPSGTAIRSGKSACVQDFTTDPNAAPWRDIAIQRGYRSSIALPLQDDRARTFGVLNIYSVTPNTFTPAEMRVLEELAGDLGFGISVLKDRQALRALIENSPDVIVRYDREGRRIYVNPEFERVNHLTAQQVLGTKPLELSTELTPMAATFTEKLMAAMASGTVTKIDLSWTTDGKQKCWFVRVVPEFDADGKVASALTIWSDISERKTAEEEIRKLNQELEQRVADRTAQLEAANKELEAFSYSVSHDLRAPLRHIDGFLGLLRERTATQLDEESRHFVSIIAKATKSMGALIDDLLSFSRMGRFEMANTQVDLGALARDIIRELEPETRARDIHWQVEDIPVVTGDRAMLRVVLDNLISNALKFTLRRQTAEIAIGCVPGHGTETIVFVRDNGAGFDMKYADKLFGVFQRLHRVDEFEGTGIGLANVRRVVTRHGGRTWAEGKVDGGATFYFSLPHSVRKLAAQ